MRPQIGVQGSHLFDLNQVDVFNRLVSLSLQFVMVIISLSDGCRESGGDGLVLFI